MILLALVPSLAGAHRVAELLRRNVVTPDNARFMAAPTSALLHLVASVIFALLGAFQFSPGLRARRPSWHRLAGRVFVVCGLVSGVTALWLTLTYPHVETDGPALFYIRLLVAPPMLISLILGFAAIRRWDVTAHRAWMMRAYALGMGAGTQVLTHLPYFIIVRGAPRGWTRDSLMGAGWLINVLVAEWIIRRQPRLAANSDR